MAEASYLANHGCIRDSQTVHEHRQGGRHNYISLLLPLFETYGLEVPENEAVEHIELPASLVESFEEGGGGAKSRTLLSMSSSCKTKYC